MTKCPNGRHIHLLYNEHPEWFITRLYQYKLTSKKWNEYSVQAAPYGVALPPCDKDFWIGGTRLTPEEIDIIKQEQTNQEYEEQQNQESTALEREKAKKEHMVLRFRKAIAKAQTTYLRKVQTTSSKPQKQTWSKTKSPTSTKLPKVLPQDLDIHDYITCFKETAEQVGLTKANPATAQYFVNGLTTLVKCEMNKIGPTYGYCMAVQQAIQAVKSLYWDRKVISLLMKTSTPTKPQKQQTSQPPESYQRTGLT